ncbi:MAG: copper chaperone PCu(A)C [Hyphomonadaceae bacterium]|nr:copper chaperone PCu(A)C [Hyphomonadaceae bacterium]
MTPMRWLFAALTLTLVTACGNAAGPGSAEAVSEAEISAGNAFVMVPLDGRDVTMAGVDIAVTGQSVRLIEARATFAERVELHTMAMVDNKMQMRHVDGLDIAAGETLQLKRGGNHIMLFGVEALEPEEAYNLSLVFETEAGEHEVIDILARARAFGD